jgi:hypothetical protein
MTSRVGGRVRRRVASDYPPATADGVIASLEALSLEPWAIDDDAAGRERIQVAILQLADGDASRIADGINLARIDWRDLLVAAGLGFDDWRERVAAYLEVDA